MVLPQFKISDINQWKPCYDPTKWKPVDFAWDANIMLSLSEVPVKDRLWVVSNPGVLPSAIASAYNIWLITRGEQLAATPAYAGKVAPDLFARFQKNEATLQEVMHVVWEQTDGTEQLAKLQTLLRLG